MRSAGAGEDGTGLGTIPRNGFVQFVSVRKTYDGASMVVKDLNLDINQGEFLTLLGPSGSGKTTTLMMLAGFEMPTAGDIRLQNRSIRDLPPYRRDIGVVFQNYALFPHLTVEENVGFALVARRRSKDEIAARTAAALDMVKLGNFRNRRPQELSGGQQQRVALARALVFEPKLVLMDEPLGALDKQLREHMQLEIKNLHAKLGVTMVYVTHDQSEALTLSDRVAVFHNGEIQQLAAPQVIYETPANAFVASFIGDNNEMKGTVVELTDGVCRVRTDRGQIVQATPVDLSGVGDGALLSVRPERIAIGAQAADCNNRFDGRVLDLIYHGDHTRLRVMLSDRSELVIKASRDQIGSMSPSAALSVGWRSGDCRAFRCP